MICYLNERTEKEEKKGKEEKKKKKKKVSILRGELGKYRESR
jgi:hypothetical protein